MVAITPESPIGAVFGTHHKKRKLAERLAAHVEERHPHVDVAVHEGGQPRYPLLVSVE